MKKRADGRGESGYEFHGVCTLVVSVELVE